MSHPADRMPGAQPESTTPLRFVTAASLFDGHDAAINIMRRLIQAQGVEVIHLGHNRSVDEIVKTAVQEVNRIMGVDSFVYLDNPSATQDNSNNGHPLETEETPSQEG